MLQQQSENAGPSFGELVTRVSNQGPSLTSTIDRIVENIWRWADRRDYREQISQEQIAQGVQRLQLNKDEENILNTLFHILFWQLICYPENNLGVSNIAQLEFKRRKVFFTHNVFQVIQFILGDLNRETLSEIIQWASTLEGECHQASSILDRMLQIRYRVGLLTRLKSADDLSRAWPDFFIAAKKLFHDYAFDEVIQKIAYQNESGEHCLLIAHGKYVQIYSILKNLFSLDLENQKGICEFTLPRSAITFNLWEGEAYVLIRMLRTLCSGFESIIYSESRFERFIFDVFHESGNERNCNYSAPLVSTYCTDQTI